MPTHCKASLPVLSHAMQRLQCCVIWKKILMVLMVGILRLRSGTFPNCQLSPPSDMPASSWNFISRTPPTSGYCQRPGVTSPKETSQRSCAASTCRHVVPFTLTACSRTLFVSTMTKLHFYEMWPGTFGTWAVTSGGARNISFGGPQGEIIAHMGVAISRNMKCLLTLLGFFTLLFQLLR